MFAQQLSFPWSIEQLKTTRSTINTSMNHASDNDKLLVNWLVGWLVVVVAVVVVNIINIIAKKCQTK